VIAVIRWEEVKEKIAWEVTPLDALKVLGTVVLRPLIWKE
jgi:hypothetical protein